MELRRAISAIHREDIPLKTRLRVLSLLVENGTPERLLVLCNLCSSPERTIAEHSRKLLCHVPRDRRYALIDYVLWNAVEDRCRWEVLDLIHQVKPRDILRYVLQNTESFSEDSPSTRRFIQWLRQARLLKEWMQYMLTMPREAALKLACALSKVDTDLPMKLARLAQHPDSRRSVRALDLLGAISPNRKIVPLIVNAAMGQNPQIRSKAILVLGKLVGNFTLMKKAFADWDDRVRANTVEALWGMDTPQARELLWLAADDYNSRVRANAVKGLYNLGELSVLDTLDEMLDSDKDAMRISGVWVLGEIGTEEMADRLKPLLTDPNGAVQRNAISALKKIERRSTPNEDQSTPNSDDATTHS